jgi:phosphopantetheinyl transferase
MSPWSLDPEAWSWNKWLAVLAQKALGHFRLIVLPVTAKGQRLKPWQEPPKSDGRRLTAEAESVAVLISAELDQHPAQAGFDGVGELCRICFEDEPGANAEPRDTENDGEEGQPDQRGRRPKQDVGTEDDPVQPQHGASAEENRSVTGDKAQCVDPQDGEIRERYDHDTSAKSMTVCGVGEKVVSRLLDDRLADRLSGRLALRQAYAAFRQSRPSLPPHPIMAHRPDGRPYLPVDSRLYCSISHSHRCGVAAVALAPVGIDIETIRPRDPRLLNYVAEETEAAPLRDLVKSPAELLTLIWTLKEATAKASGLGLGLALRRLRVTATGTHCFEINGWSAVSYHYEHFVVGLAFQQSAHGRPPIRWYQPGRLPTPEIAEDAGGIETIEADPLQRQVSQ